MSRQNLERELFRRLNSVVEPAVRRGLGAPRLLPSGLIVLESRGFKTGLKRSTPLLATRLGRYLLVSTFRAERSFWLRNLREQPRVSYYLAGRERTARAIVIMPGKRYRRPAGLPAAIGRLTDVLATLTRSGWGFALLVPVAGSGAA
ncbi:MAG: nitroreductase family deazaflavin-dependent oxidoreductase [Halieaceae bacterium]|nr:nitroreductase family deazaflavin-dependent oxidoreductase [Halieaceae bacterium]